MILFGSECQIFNTKGFRIYFNKPSPVQPLTFDEPIRKEAKVAVVEEEAPKGKRGGYMGKKQEIFPDIMNSKLVARYLLCSVGHIGRLCRDNLIPHFRLGTMPRFNKDEIDQWRHNPKSFSATPNVSTQEQ